MRQLLLQFIHCHHGKINRILHLIGLITLGYGVWQKNLTLLIAGAIIQEIGHVYQYYKTGQLKDSPLSCIKPQSVFAYPIFIGLVLYVVFV